VFDRVPIQSVQRPDSAFDTISLDCAGPIEPPSGRGHHYLLVMIDHCSRWAECIPLKTLTAKETCNALKIFFSNFGIEMRNSTPPTREQSSREVGTEH